MPAEQARVRQEDARQVLAETTGCPTSWLRSHDVSFEPDAIIRAMLAYAEAAHARGYRAAVEAAAGVAEKAADAIDAGASGALLGWTVTRARVDAYRTIATSIRALGASDGGEG